MIERLITQRVLRDLTWSPIVSLIGSRQVGKTTLARYVQTQIEQIMREAPEFSDFYYYRTQNGAEVDLLMITPNGKMGCIEIKFSTTPTISKGFYQSVEYLKPNFKYVITPSVERFDREGGLRICPLNIFLEEELPTLDQRNSPPLSISR